MGISSTVRYLIYSSCVCAFIATVFHAVAFGTRRWLERAEESPFGCIGIHEACFHNCYHPHCPSVSGDVDVIYDGCHWLYDYHFRFIWDWLMPDWWDQCRNMAIVNVPLITICFILLVILSLFAWCGKDNINENRTRELILLIVLYVVAVFLFVAMLLALATLTIFYSNCFKYDYMPMPEKNRLGWSYWLEVVALIFLVYATVATTVAAIFKTMRRCSPEKSPHYAEDMMMGRRY